MPTLVAFHAHPDDEVLLTGGTPARAVAEGHRVVLVVDPPSYRPREAITHRIDVRRHAAAKRAALAAHRSQVAGPGRAARLFQLLVRMPVPVFGLLLGREWYVESSARGDR